MITLDEIFNINSPFLLSKKLTVKDKHIIKLIDNNLDIASSSRVITDSNIFEHIHNNLDNIKKIDKKLYIVNILDLSFIFTCNYYYVNDNLIDFYKYDENLHNNILERVVINDFNGNFFDPKKYNAIKNLIDQDIIKLFENKNFIIRDIIISKVLNLQIPFNKLEKLKKDKIDFIKNIIDQNYDEYNIFHILKTLKQNIYNENNYYYFLAFNYMKNSIIDKEIDNIKNSSNSLIISKE